MPPRRPRRNPLPRRVLPEEGPRPFLVQVEGCGVVCLRFVYHGTLGMRQRASREPFLLEVLVAGFGALPLAAGEKRIFFSCRYRSVPLLIAIPNPAAQQIMVLVT